ncbi:MAG TPA: class III extradiol ring-cleavage dioxygenase, partial [Planctomycetota bacterium]|nr:class III extradiol ring-cleavage dioxygenase [Planctomycetota bacterium]
WTMGPPDTWEKMRGWLSRLPGTLPQPPRAIVVISGHWETREFAVTGSAHPPLIYDYSGFPPETYQLQYPAPGDPALAEQIRGLLTAAGFEAKIDAERGFDHGVFIPFKVIYPAAQIPIVQLSVLKSLDPAVHLAAGRALAPLRAENVLIVGSGMSYHNLRELFRGGKNADSDRFDGWLTPAVTGTTARERDASLQDWAHAPAARNAHPREEHLIPLMVAAGAAGEDRGVRIFSDRVMGATVSAYGFGLAT